MKPVINIDEVEFEARPSMFQPKGEAAERYDAQLGQIATRIGAKKLGYNITRVPPGKRAYPSHNHQVNEEMFFVLQGSGELLHGEERYPLRVGDVVACPPGGAAVAHQIINTGAEELRYLAVSTRLYPELVEYPNSGKFGVMAERAPGPDGKPSMFRFVGREAQGVEYWDGE